MEDRKTDEAWLSKSIANKIKSLKTKSLTKKQKKIEELKLDIEIAKLEKKIEEVKEDEKTK